MESMDASERISRLGLVLVACITAAAVWDKGGLRAATLPYYSVLAVLLLGLTTYQALQHARRQGRRLPRLDPFVLFGCLFLAYLLLQWWNAGRVSYLDVAYQRWVYGPPRHPALPHAFTRPEAAEILYWFFTAWVLALHLRVQTHQSDNRRIGTLWLFLVLQASLLAAVGIVQFATGASILPYTWQGRRIGFASFGYPNHAAAYFVMMAAVAAGILYRELFKKQATRNRLRAGLCGAAMLLSLVAANLSLSRAGLILAWSLALFIALYGLLHGWHRLRRVTRFHFTLATLAILAVCYFLVSGFGSNAIKREFSIKKTITSQHILARAGINLDLSIRPALWQGGWRVFLANRWYGNGAWGFRYDLAMHTPEDQWNLIRKSGVANVHNDPIQFLSEFGIVGSGLLLLALACLIVPLVQSPILHGSLFWMTTTGLILVCIFSLIDLPFRSPAILWTWTTLLAALPGVSSGQLTRSSIHGSNPQDREQQYAE